MKKKNTYFCVPIALGLPVLFLAYIPVLFWLFFIVIKADNPTDYGIFIVLVTASLLMAAITSRMAFWRVELLQDHLVCKDILPRESFSLEYEKCNIGMDYHDQNGGQVWWIYLCYGNLNNYKKKPRARMNEMRCQPGFVRIMYSDEVYEALMEVLPQKQRTGLITSRRVAGFEKQGKII